MLKISRLSSILVIFVTAENELALNGYFNDCGDSDEPVMLVLY